MPFVKNHSRKEAAPPPAPHICAYLRFCGKVSRRELYCCEIAAARKTECRAVGEHWVFLSLTEILFVSSRKICEHLLFEYRALYVVHVFGDAVVHAHQLHDFVARVDDGGVIAPAHDLADGDEGKRKHIAH